MNRGSQEEFECVISSRMLGKSATKSIPGSISCRWDQPRRTLISGSNAVELGSNQARCSVKAIHDIISGLDERKKKLVESMGFGGLLKFPPIKSTNRWFSAWLMGMVDVTNSSLTMPDGSVLRFTKKDIAIVFGIPDTGKRVNEAGL
jgi:hypothetical protein